MQGTRWGGTINPAKQPHRWQRGGQDRAAQGRTGQEGKAQHLSHEVKGAIRWDERDGAVALKRRQAHALVELHVLQVNGLLTTAAALGLKQHLRGEEQGQQQTRLVAVGQAYRGGSSSCSGMQGVQLHIAAQDLPQAAPLRTHLVVDAALALWLQQGAGQDQAAVSQCEGGLRCNAPCSQARASRVGAAPCLRTQSHSRSPCRSGRRAS